MVENKNAETVTFDMEVGKFKIEVVEGVIESITHKESGRDITSKGEEGFTADDYKELLVDFVTETKAWENVVRDLLAKIAVLEDESDTFYKQLIEAETFIEDNRSKLEG